LSAPSAEKMNATEIRRPPASPKTVCAAFVATGSASRNRVEFAVTTSPNGSA
jgi:hypothetical protein